MKTRRIVTLGLLVAVVAATSACHRAWRHHHGGHHGEAPAEILPPAMAFTAAEAPA